MAGQRVIAKPGGPVARAAQTDFTGQKGLADCPICLHKSATCHNSRMHFTPIAADDLMGKWRVGLAISRPAW
jgi:hypothetical protein